MSTRYDDTYRDREYEPRGRNERLSGERATARDERETAGRGLRRDVRETGQDIHSAGSDIVSSLCGLWGNLLISLGEVITPQSSRGGSARRGDPDEGGEGRSGFSCGGGEFSIRCDTSEGRAEGRGGRGAGGGRGGRGGRDDRDDRDDRDSRTTAHFSGGDTEIDVAT